MIGSILGGAVKVIVELDDGTDMVSLHGPIEGSNDGIPYGSLLGDSLMNPSYSYFDVSSDVPPEGALLGGTN